MPASASATAPSAVKAWRAQAAAEYGCSLPGRREALRVELAARVLTLTGRDVSPEDVYASAGGHQAVVGVDGTTFRLRGGIGGELVVVRSCAYCGTGSFESPPVDGPADLGYALLAWVPVHEDCEYLFHLAEDLAAW